MLLIRGYGFTRHFARYCSGRNKSKPLIEGRLDSGLPDGCSDAGRNRNSHFKFLSAAKLPDHKPLVIEVMLDNSMRSMMCQAAVASAQSLLVPRPFPGTAEYRLRKVSEPGAAGTGMPDERSSSTARVIRLQVLMTPTEA